MFNLISTILGLTLTIFASCSALYFTGSFVIDKIESSRVLSYVNEGNSLVIAYSNYFKEFKSLPVSEDPVAIDDNSHLLSSRKFIQESLPSWKYVTTSDSFNFRAAGGNDDKSPFEVNGNYVYYSVPLSVSECAIANSLSDNINNSQAHSTFRCAMWDNSSYLVFKLSH